MRSALAGVALALAGCGDAPVDAPADASPCAPADAAA
ncbi:MAG: hypothetical protein JWM10_1786, partial [Myxococcaceae bacterium]|nr:hypothetical protein [Myxococcaceae bacterium]